MTCMESRPGGASPNAGRREPQPGRPRPIARRDAPQPTPEGGPAEDAMARLWAQAVHDLRQPVQAARLLAGMLDDTSSGAELQRAAHGIGSALQSLQEMLEALTLIARTEAGLLVVELSACRLAGALEPALRDLAEIAASRDIRLRPGILEEEVRSHPKLLATIVRSLIVTTIRFGDSGEVIIGCRRGRGRVTLDIRFAGPPVDQKIEAHAFVQLAPPGDRDSAGELGMGLALLRRLCRALGHELHYAAPAPGRQRLALIMPSLSR
jgi:signal transduction histidine kinase